MSEHRHIPITEQSQIAEARRTAVELAVKVGLDQTQSGKLAIVVTEAATNILRHATSGELMLCSIGDGARVGVEMLAIDRGPGMADVARCFVDGHTSLAGSPGEGLGAIARLATEHDVYSKSDGGTVLMARVFGRNATPTPPPSPLEIGGVAAPFPGETECGDAWASMSALGSRRVIVADGLGHGTGAAEASLRAVSIFAATMATTPHQVIEHLHVALRKTRGAAIAIADIDYAARTIAYCGIGNISGSIMSSSGSQSLVSINGTVGAAVRKVQTFNYEFPPNAVLVMYSDGLTTHWSFSAYPGLLTHHPSVIAGVIYRDHRRVNNDDVTVVVVKDREAT
jgi:anti-sigma regulatory factor (Ser/Thr protein kinase)